MKQYSLKVLFGFVIVFAVLFWIIFLRQPPRDSQTEEGTSVQNTLPNPADASPYPLHDNINATVFWVGEPASEHNNFIHNKSSSWTRNWTGSYGGTDDPENRNGWHPAQFTPLENPFYIALPYSDYTPSGLKKNADQIYWYSDPIPTGGSIIKNQWVKINRLGKTAYAQWEDAGPFEYDDLNYVFGTAGPQQTVGIDLSPATAEYLGIDGSGIVSWQFVPADLVPDGPWSEIITTSGPDFR